MPVRRLFLAALLSSALVVIVAPVTPAMAASARDVAHLIDARIVQLRDENASLGPPFSSSERTTYFSNLFRISQLRRVRGSVSFYSPSDLNVLYEYFVTYVSPSKPTEPDECDPRFGNRDGSDDDDWEGDGPCNNGDWEGD